MTASRPFGISLLASGYLLESILALILAGYVILSPNGGSGFAGVLEKLQISAALAALLAVPPLMTAGLAGLLFRGLWNSREWARLAAIVMAFLCMAAAVGGIAFVRAFDLATVGNQAAAVALLLLAVVSFIYLLRTRLVDHSIPLSQQSSTQSTAYSPPAYVERLPSLTPPPLPIGRANAAPALVPPPPRAPAPGQLSGDLNAATLASPSAAPLPAPTRQLAAPASSLASAAEPMAWLIVRQGLPLGRQFSLYPDRTLVIGRDPDRAQGLLSDAAVSGRHAEVRYEQGRFVIYDLDSTNGIYYGELQVQRHSLLDGDEIRLGNTLLLFVKAKSAEH